MEMYYFTEEQGKKITNLHSLYAIYLNILEDMKWVLLIPSFTGEITIIKNNLGYIVNPPPLLCCSLELHGGETPSPTTEQHTTYSSY